MTNKEMATSLIGSEVTFRQGYATFWGHCGGSFVDAWGRAGIFVFRPTWLDGYVGIYDNQLDIDGPNQVLLSQVKTK